MSDRTSHVDTTQSPASGGQPAWDEDRAACWLANADARERQLQPVSDALFERASLRPGERVLDVGVGSRPTTGQAWEAVRPDGSVTGIDIAALMITAARQRSQLTRSSGSSATQRPITSHRRPMTPSSPDSG